MKKGLDEIRRLVAEIAEKPRNPSLGYARLITDPEIVPGDLAAFITEYDPQGNPRLQSVRHDKDVLIDSYPSQRFLRCSGMRQIVKSVGKLYVGPVNSLKITPRRIEREPGRPRVIEIGVSCVTEIEPTWTFSFCRYRNFIVQLARMKFNGQHLGLFHRDIIPGPHASQVFDQLLEINGI